MHGYRVFFRFYFTEFLPSVIPAVPGFHLTPARFMAFHLDFTVFFVVVVVVVVVVVTDCDRLTRMFYSFDWRVVKHFFFERSDHTTIINETFLPVEGVTRFVFIIFFEWLPMMNKLPRFIDWYRVFRGSVRFSTNFFSISPGCTGFYGARKSSRTSINYETFLPVHLAFNSSWLAIQYSTLRFFFFLLSLSLSFSFPLS